jgi:hypothetical protein
MRRDLRAVLLLLPLAAPAVADAPPGRLMAAVHTGGRIEPSPDGMIYTWPGVYFEARFSGERIGVVLHESGTTHNVEIDGKRDVLDNPPARIVRLPPGVHVIRVSNRTASGSGRFVGFHLLDGEAQKQDPPAARTRQIEIIGDGIAAGTGNAAPGRECTLQEVERYSDADLSFGVLTARRYDADYQLNAHPALGLVRGDPALLARLDGWKNPDWKPRLVVITVGALDFDAPPDRRSTDKSLAAAFQKAYRERLARIRAEYGPDTTIVVGVLRRSDVRLAKSAEAVVRGVRAAGDTRVVYWHYDGPDGAGCHGYPSAAEHQKMSDALVAVLDGLPAIWGPPPAAAAAPPR